MSIFRLSDIFRGESSVQFQPFESIVNLVERNERREETPPLPMQTEIFERDEEEYISPYAQPTDITYPPPAILQSHWSVV